MSEISCNGDKNNNTAKRKYLGYRGEWYDVTNFVERHPGGDIIEKFVGQDATHVIDTAHSKDVLKSWKPVSLGRKDAPEPYQYDPTSFEKQMLALHVKLKKNGFYDDSVGWFIRKFIIVASLNVVIFILLFNYSNIFYIQCLCSFLLAAFWQQSGMLMHDLMHSQAFQNRKIDEIFGVFFGTFCFGISSRWWKDEHIVHHALTNTVDYASGFIDPQAHEDVWAQNEKLFPFMCEKIHHFFIKIQYWTFLPFCILIGRFGILVDSYRLERRKDVWLAFALHLIWISAMINLLPGWKSRILFYYFASVGEGILHIQLLMNHYSKPFYEKEDMHETGFFRAMVDCNINIVCPVWMDWFHGGLNFHIEHHCFPRMPRNRLREVSPMIKKICAESGILYDECSFTSALTRTMSHLKSVSKLFTAMKDYN
ncbi:uncharacterized protein LOC120339347 isoform X1 [Styela clava]